MADTAANRELLRRQIEELWGQGRIELVAELYTDDAVDHMPLPGQMPGVAGLREAVMNFHGAMPDLSITVHGIIAEGDWAVDFWTLDATHTGEVLGLAPTGKRVRFSGIDMVRVRDGRIADIWHVEELLQMMVQIGADPVAFGQPAGGVDRVSSDVGAKGEALNTGVDLHGIARQHIEGIWAAGNERLAWSLYAPDVVDHNPAPDQQPGIPGIIDVLRWLRDSVPDLEMHIEAYVVNGVYAADRWRMTGTHTGAPLMGVEATGRTFQINGMDVIRVRPDGLISDVWHVEELASLLAQIRPA